MQGEAPGGTTLSRLRFSGREAAVNASCRGDGTLFVIVGWVDVSSASGPTKFETSAFPCLAPLDEGAPSRIELSTAPTGEADVNVFVLERPSATVRASFAVSIEERDP